MVGNRPEGIVSVIPSPKGRQDVTGSIYLSVCLLVVWQSIQFSRYRFQVLNLLELILGENQ